MGSDQHAGLEEAGKSQASSSVGGVNRRTAVLFGNKTPRRNVARVGGQSPTARRPGRPPKQQHTPATSEMTKNTEATTENQHSLTHESADEVVPKKRGRKKRSAAEPAGIKEFGSRLGEVVGSITTEWSAVARPQTSVSTRRTPQKESFRQYRVMDDSDTEGAAKSDTDGQMAHVTSSSASSSEESSDNNNSSSQSDNDDDEDGASSSCSSTTHNSGRQRHSTAQDMTTGLKPLDLVWAKCKGYPWYPAQVIDPEMPRTGIVHGSVTVQAPPEDVLKLRQKYSHEVFLVVFYDTKRTWRWLPRRKLDPLGIDAELDGIKLTANNKANVCAAVQRAYDRAREEMSGASAAAGGTRQTESDSTADATT